MQSRGALLRGLHGESGYLNTLLYKLMQKLFEKGHVGIVEKVQETSLGTGMHNRAINMRSMNCGCVLESRDTPHHTVYPGNNLIPISVPLECSCVGYVHSFYTQ